MEFPRVEAPLLNEEEEIICQITDWFIPENDKNKEKTEEPELYSIVIYGTTNNGNNVAITVKDYEPYFYVKPPDNWENYSDNMFLNEMSKFDNTIREDKYECIFKKNGMEQRYHRKIIPRYYDDHYNGLKMVKRKDFWGFTNNKNFRFMKVSVKSLSLFNNLKYYFTSLKNKGFKLYESNIDPFLRYIHEQDIKPCGWISIKKYDINSDTETESRCDYNIETNYKNITSIDINNIAPLLIASFDIECTSSHGDFPVAIKDYKKVAQDLTNVAKAGYEINEELLRYWLKTIFTEDVIIDNDIKINKVYPKNKVINLRIEEILEDCIEILNKIYEVVEDSGEEDDEEPVFKTKIVKEHLKYEGELTKILNNYLPPLKGDSIIQIGTTVHKYGSDKIIYKNIITLNDCDPIEDVDVIECKTEKKLLMEWKNLMIRLNPDVLIGYNIFGFDIEYIWNRSIECGNLEDFAMSLGRRMSRKTSLIKQELSSSALGENILKYFDMDGVVLIDLFKVMQREQKLDSYKLDSVATIFLGDHKNDLKPQEIFEKFKGSSKDRAIIAEYCIQDCALVNRLLHKLKILENNIGMGNVCLVPLNYLFRRGQGIKIFSLIAKECMLKKHLIPVKSYCEGFEADEGYEGAVVLEPKEGIYLNDPIVVFDYGSLYPSSMIARNLSHDCYILDEKYMVEDPNIEYTKVTYDLYEGTGDKKRKSGEKNCIFAQYKDGRKGIIAEILCMLLQQRKNTRKKIEYKTVMLQDGTSISGILNDIGDNYECVNIDTGDKIKINKENVKEIIETYNKFEQDVFDALQLAYKITANSLYGQIGARTSPIYLKEIAACTTATGREMIMLAKNYVETNYNAEVIYGDSVMPYTPLTYRANNSIYITTFEKMDGLWNPYDEFKAGDSNRRDKEQFIPNNICAWTNKGWSKINRIIRHRTLKNIYRITTNKGIVDVTEDHSLIDINNKKIKPSDCYIGKQLLHSNPLYNITRTYTNTSAYYYGIFMYCGKCNIVSTDYGYYYEWIIENHNNNLLLQYKTYLENITKIKFIIKNNSLKLDENSNNALLFIKEYNRIFYIDTHKIIPNNILNGDVDTLKSFYKGLKKSSYNTRSYNASNQLTAQNYLTLFQMLNKEVIIENTDGYMITIVKNNRQDDIDIKSIEILYNNYYGYVYDIETEEGVFNAGIGNMILKNTDSIFCKFPLKDGDGNMVNGKEALKYAIEIGKHVEKNIVSIMPFPQKLNYEKSLYPFIIFSKKRYVGNLYEMDDKHFKQKSMGIVLKRRDNAHIVKKIYGGIIDILLNKQDLEASIEFLKEELEDLVNGKTPIEELVISKSLRASYKDATKIAHKVLADRIGDRDAGNKPAVNDRIPFVYIKVADAKLQGDRIENPEYIVQNGLMPDYLHYITNQIMKPILQLYALCLDELPNYNKSPDYWDELEKDLLFKPIYQDDIKRKHRLDNLKLNAVKELLFDPYIEQLSEPKKKAIKLPKIVDVTDVAKTTKTTKVTKTTKNKKETVTAGVSEITGVTDVTDVTAITEVTELNGVIKVIKKAKSDILDATAKILNGKTIIWNYSNDKSKDKHKEIKIIILEMIKIINNNKITIKINNKQFVKEYNSSIAKYNEFVNNEINDENLVKKAMKDNDIGMMQNVTDVLKYEKILEHSNIITIIE